ncbi:hypothetical protein TVAG_210590 [Trichomonas vaginalis G3]|uniref:Uncharacterized protein n=1 Tax=Trichomonas vaginalis (strain ATCC PRA-98 / G3) TaxID=412133 RepID=A2FV37_TRIV3|nr:hypothetical protein TVAGG3_0314590 [Trichomonas vaginalis G3]EAX91234.1 hypothetical protein TVAG_210590 [Trichomonas vaginalis G3]KAI5528853.1 hypothetical protein TVAGG3_0314590 [Trichomonas vaginalis G3]|eukprot:XP_001304164.1 hypothetical protein [Trichomonas vaginalis G3]
MKTEIQKNEREMQMKINELSSYKNKISSKETTYKDLTDKKNLIFETTESTYNEYSELLGKNQSLKQQNFALEKLLEKMQKRIKESAGIETQTLNEAQIAQIQDAVKQTFDLIADEYEIIDFDKLKSDTIDLVNERQRLESELSLYRTLFDEKAKNDQLEAIIDQFTNDPNEQELSQLINLKSYPNFDENPNYHENHATIDQSIHQRTDSFISQIQAQIQSNSRVSNLIKNIYKDQKNFLHHCAETASNTKDISKSFKQLEQKIEDAGEAGKIEIQPLSIDFSENSDQDSINPLEIFTKDFVEMTENAISQLPTVSFYEDSISRAEESLNLNTDIPDFNPDIVRTEIRSKDLSELNSKITKFILTESNTDIEVPDQQMHEQQETAHETTVSPKIELPEIDNSEIEEVIDLIHEKLPPSFAKRFSKDSLHPPLQQPTEIDEILEFEPSLSLFEKQKHLNDVISSINNQEFMMDPVLLRPQEVTESIISPERVDFHSILSSVDQLLTRNDKDIEKEIAQIRQKTKALRRQIDESGEVQVSIDEVENIKKEKEKVSLQINAAQKELSSKKGMANLMKKNIEMLRSDLSSLNRTCDSIDCPKKSVSDLENELNKIMRKIGTFHTK